MSGIGRKVALERKWIAEERHNLSWKPGRQKTCELLRVAGQQDRAEDCRADRAAHRAEELRGGGGSPHYVLRNGVLNGNYIDRHEKSQSDPERNHVINAGDLSSCNAEGGKQSHSDSCNGQPQH